MRKIVVKALIAVILLASAGCYHAPRTSWTPNKYKKKPYRPNVNVQL